MNTILLEDFKLIAEYDLPWQEFKNKSFFITGGTGFLGSLLIKFLHYLNLEKKLNIKISTLVRNGMKAQELLKECNVNLIEGDMCEILEIKDGIDFIIHCAATTKSKTMIENPVQTIEGIVNGTQNILKLADKKKVKSVVYLSSMEMYGVTDSTLISAREEDLGYVDILNVRSCYPMGKRMAENICFSYYTQYGVPVKIARLAQTFGAGVLEDENRVFMQFAKSAMNKENIILHTTGNAMGNYCYTADAISAIMFLLLKGENGHAYNVVNEATTMTVIEMAELVTEKIADNNIAVIFDIPKENSYGYAVPGSLKLSSEKIKELGWKPGFDLEDMYGRMIKYMTN